MPSRFAQYHDVGKAASSNDCACAEQSLVGAGRSATQVRIADRLQVVALAGGQCRPAFDIPWRDFIVLEVMGAMLRDPVVRHLQHHLQ